MAVHETNIANKILDAVSPHGARLFKNVRGTFLTLDGTRKVAAGLRADGASDLIGMIRVKVTPEMVGTTIAVFAAIECKTATGQVKPHQEKFVNFVRKMGGFAGIARNVEDAKRILRLPLDGR